MLRPYFRYDRSLLKDLCRIAHQCLLEFMQTSLGLPGGIPGIVMTIHTFGEYLDKGLLPPERARMLRGLGAFGFQPKCSREMRIVALIDDREVIERILRHLGLWVQGVRVFPARAPPEAAEWVIEPCYDDPFPCLPRRSEAKTGLRHRTG